MHLENEARDHGLANPDRSATSTHGGLKQSLLSCTSLTGNDVVNMQHEEVGGIKDFMLDTRTGRISYAVLTFGGFLGIGQKLLAVPWSALTLDRDNKRFVLNVSRDRLKDAPGFDKDHWPDMADPKWGESIHSYYGTKPDHFGPTL